MYHLPLFEITSILFQSIDLSQHDIMIFLSANAVENFFSRYQHIIPAHIKIIAIGPATTSALTKYSAHYIITPTHFSSEGIAALPEMQAVKNKSIVIISGENSKPVLSQTLKKRGAHVDHVICYQRRVITYDMKKIFAELSARPISHIISTSLESLNALLQLFCTPTHRLWILQKTLCIVNHHMKQLAIGAGFQNIIQADNATDEAMIHALCKQDKSL